MKKYFFSFVLFTIIVSTLFIGCETLGSGKGGKQPYFSEKNEQKFLQPDKRIGFTIEGLSEKIQFKKDGKTLMLPFAYQEDEEVFGFDEEEIEVLNSDSGDRFWIRMNKVLNTNKKQWPFQAAKSNNWGGNVLYILYLADFINMYETKIPSMVDITNAPDWFKEVLVYRKNIPNYGKSDKDLINAALNAKVEAGNKEVVVSWTTNKYLKGVIIEWYHDSYQNRQKITITDGSTKYVFKDLKNLKPYRFKVSFADNSGEIVKKTYWISATPKSGDKNKDYIKGPSDFVNAKYELLLTKDYGISCYDWDDDVSKISFSEDGKIILVPNKFLRGENIFKYTKEEMGYGDIFWTRMEKVLKTKDKQKSFFASIAGENGNVLWLLYCADFLNVYQAKLPNMVDLSNAPDWFKALMEQRKDSPDSYVQDDYK